MKKVLPIILAIALLLVIVSCQEEPKDSYMDYPLNAVTYKEPTKDTSVLTGTYYVGDSGYSLFQYGEYFWISFKDNGTLIATPAYKMLYASSKDKVEGTWSISGTTMTISVYDKSYTGTKYDVDGAGFGVRKSSYDSLALAKESNSLLSTVTKSSIEGLWFIVNDYGKNYGYRFLSDGTCYQYSSDGSTYKTTWALSTNGTKILIGELSDYNIAIIGEYLYLNASGFQKVK